MARVLVTGATGFIGNHLVKLLSQARHDVTCLIRRASNTRQLKDYEPRFCYGDVRDPDAVNRAVMNQDLVFHLAGLTKSFRSQALYDVNATGTGNVARGCMQVETPPTLIVVSSIAAAGPASDDRPRVESDPCHPVSDYGKSKLSAEQLAIKMCGARVPLSIVRPPIVFGEGDHDGFALFGSIANWGLHMVPTFKDHSFSLIHAEDLAIALYKTAQSGSRVEPEDSTNGTYFVSANETPTYAELGRMIGRAVGRADVRVVYNLGVVVRAIAATNQVIGRLRRRPQILNLDKAKEALAGSWTCSNAAIFKDTGFRPVKSLEARLRQTVEWYAALGMLQIKDESWQIKGIWNEKNRALRN